MSDKKMNREFFCQQSSCRFFMNHGVMLGHENPWPEQGESEAWRARAVLDGGGESANLILQTRAWGLRR